MKLADVGEFGAIRLFQDLLGARPICGGIVPVVGIGDDAAVWQPSPGSLALETTDLLVEEVHFSLRWSTWHEVGWKAMAVNISDIAAMGGQPRAAFVSAGLSPDMPREAVLELYGGLADCAAEYGTAILGGDTVAAPRAAVLNVAVYGEALSAVLRRDAGRVGDAIGVSGPLGASAAYVFRQDEAFRAAHMHPSPRVALGQQLTAAGARCALDISDGLLGDLAKLCAASGVGAEVRSADVPVAASVQQALPAEALRLALTGGEDYELLVCGDEEMLLANGLTVIGRVVGGSDVRVVDSSEDFGAGGYDAFR